MKILGLDETDDDSSDVELVPEHELENRAVDAGGYTFDGDIGDDELYNLKKQQPAIQIKGKDDGKCKVSGRAKKVATSNSTKNNPGVSSI